MKFSRAIDMWIDDMWSSGRITSPRTERTYRSTLVAHADDVGNRDPRTVGRDDVKKTLARWPKPNTQRTRRAALVSFYKWTVEEGIRPYNPAAQTRTPRKQPTSVYRLTIDEVQAMLNVVETTRERRAIYLAICAGLRNAELRGLQGRHFRRPGLVWVSKDIAKGGRERWVPVLAELSPTWHEIAASVADDEYVLPAQRWRDPGDNKIRGDLAKRASSSQALRTLVMEVAARAGIKAHIHPHLLRHAFGDHIAKSAGLLIAQALLGHASVETTRTTYVGSVSLDELLAATRAITINGLPPEQTTQMAGEAPTGIEPVHITALAVEPDVQRILSGLDERVALYMEAFAA